MSELSEYSEDDLEAERRKRRLIEAGISANWERERFFRPSIEERIGGLEEAPDYRTEQNSLIFASAVDAFLAKHFNYFHIDKNSLKFVPNSAPPPDLKDVFKAIDKFCAGELIAPLAVSPKLLATLRDNCLPSAEISLDFSISPSGNRQEMSAALMAEGKKLADRSSGVSLLALKLLHLCSGGSLQFRPNYDFLSNLHLRDSSGILSFYNGEIVSDDCFASNPESYQGDSYSFINLKAFIQLA